MEHADPIIEAMRTLLASEVPGDGARAVEQLEALDDPASWRACAAGMWITGLPQRPRARSESPPPRIPSPPNPRTGGDLMDGVLLTDPRLRALAAAEDISLLLRLAVRSGRLDTATVLHCDDAVLGDPRVLIGLSDLEELSLCSGPGVDLRPLQRLPSLRTLRVSEGPQRSASPSTEPAIDMSALADMRSLRCLRLSPGRWVLDPLRHADQVHELEVTLLEHTDAAALAGMVGLRRLTFNARPGVEFTWLSSLHQLRELQLAGVDARQLGPLEGLPELRELELDSCELSSLAPLATLPQLNRVKLGGHQGVKLATLGDCERPMTLDELHVNLWETVDTFSGLAGHKIRSLVLHRVNHRADLRPLSQIEDLTALTLSGGVSDLRGLERLTTLRSLSLNNTTFDADVLAPLTQLQTLTITVPTEGLAALPPFPRLEQLTAWVRGEQDLTALEGSPQLRTLSIHGDYSLASLAPLGRLHQLEQLALCTRRVLPSVTPLSELSELHTLELVGVPSDLCGLSGLAGLRSLALQDFEADLSPLARLTSLESLKLFGRGPDLSPLCSLERLHSLQVHDIADPRQLSPLAKLGSLRSLDLTHNQTLDDLAPLAGLGSLAHLRLNDCTSLVDLSPLCGLHGLVQLDLRRCMGVEDLSPLAGLVGLRHLDIRGCRNVRDLSPLDGLPDLRVSL